jgi:hypothetical protein
MAGLTTLSCARNHPGEAISFRLFLSTHQRQREDQERHDPRRNALLPQAQFVNDVTKRWPHSDCIWLSLLPSIIRRTKAPSVSSLSIHGCVQQLGEWYKSGRGGSVGCIRNGEARDGRPSFWVLVMEFRRRRYPLVMDEHDRMCLYHASCYSFPLRLSCAPQRSKAPRNASHSAGTV